MRRILSETRRRRWSPALLLLLPLLLAACGGGPSREAVQLAGELRRTPPGPATDAMADRMFDCSEVDRACVTLWLYRGAACARLAEAPETAEGARPLRRTCAVEAFTRARALLPRDATPQERQEVAIRLADVHERRRDRATGDARVAENAAILAAVAPLRGTPAAPYADHYEAGVALNRVQAGEVLPPARCAVLREASRQAAGTPGGPGLPPLGDRLDQRRAAIAAQLAQEGCT
ncbi:hypothetical protein [Falsiroseomonas sp.]|uniref:hypothetical protein n=1 Tax=Falsiroseomonas sp. TaxID=2870721 RepID=UPI0035679002